ncbi:MAG: hypothetical protein ABIL06_16195 [Pseudomonadota bacterium]
MIEEGDKVICPSYRSWTPEGEPYMVSEEEHLRGTVGRMTALSTGPNDEPMPGTDYHVWVILDNPIGAQDVIQCKASRLIKLEE